MTIFLLDGLVEKRSPVRYIVDNKPARSVLIKGAIKQVDLNDIAGMVWRAASHRTQTYWNHWVCSDANLADKPSRGNTSVMIQLQGEEVAYEFTTYLRAVESWVFQPQKIVLVARQ